MIKLNIIPDKIKKEIKANFIYNITKKSLYIIIIFLSLFGIILMTSEYILLSALTKEMNGATLDFKSSAKTSENKVNEINNQINSLETIQNDFTRWSIFYDFITKNSPEGIIFNSISIDKNVPSVIFRGFSVDRDTLLSLKKLLEESDVFDNIDFPIKSLLQKENINFEIKAKLNIDEIK